MKVYMACALAAVMLACGCTTNGIQNSTVERIVCGIDDASCDSVADTVKLACNDSVIIQETGYLTMQTDVSNMKNMCIVKYTITDTKLESIKGTSMVCDVSMTKTNVLAGPFSKELFKYCEGALKDRWYAALSELFELEVGV